MRLLRYLVFGALLLAGIAAYSIFQDPGVDKTARADLSLKTAEVAAINELTGAPTRVVWLQDTGDGADYLAWGTDLRMVGLDTEDGEGARVLLDGPRNMVKPMFTADGEWVIFSDRQAERIFAVTWDGAEVIDLGPGFGLTTWVDPQTGMEWLYLARQRIADDRILPAYQSLHRYPLYSSETPNRPRKYTEQTDDLLELVWDQTQISEDSFQISPDGRYASTAFPWPQVGILDFEANRWIRLGQGCWVAMSPDDEYLFWVFDGPHRNVRIFRADRDENWMVNVNNGPGMDGYEVYHPRWSNHPRIIAVTGPYKVGEGAYRLPGGGAAVSIHLGRFNAERTEVVEWIQVSDETHADFYPDVWVQPQASSTDAATEIPRQETSGARQASEWPAHDRNLVYVWENAAGRHDIVDPSSGAQYIFRPEPRGLARYGKNHAMHLHGGYFIDEDAGKHLQRLGHDETVSIEFTAVQDGSPDSGESWIFGLRADESHFLTILARKDGWYLRTGFSDDIFLAPVGSDTSVHFVLTFEAGTIRTFMNDKAVAVQTVDLKPSLWADATLLFGGDGQGGHDWQGSLSRFAVYARALDREEISENFALISRQQDARPASTAALVRARVLQASAVPTPEDIAPYRRGLVVNEYELVEVLEGELGMDRFLAAHWAILDNMVLEDARRPVGSEHLMLLEPFEERPELEGERLTQDTDDFLLELFFDARFP